MISQEARSVIAAAAKDPDPVLSAQANIYLYKLTAPTCGIRCGGERWTIKSLSDPDASRLRTSKPTVTTVADLINKPAPTQLPSNARVGLEATQVRVRALLVGWKNESSMFGDQDYHIVIADPDDTTKQMIIEMPSPECQGVCSSLFVNDFKRNREQMEYILGQPKSTFHEMDQQWLVEITGSPFFDYNHGQIGLAPNCIEIHPVTNVTFLHLSSTHAHVNKRQQNVFHAQNHCANAR
jgi:hypothetical protein